MIIEKLNWRLDSINEDTWTAHLRVFGMCPCRQLVSLQGFFLNVEWHTPPPPSHPGLITGRVMTMSRSSCCGDGKAPLSSQSRELESPGAKALLSCSRSKVRKPLFLPHILVLNCVTVCPLPMNSPMHSPHVRSMTHIDLDVNNRARPCFPSLPRGEGIDWFTSKHHQMICRHVLFYSYFLLTFRLKKLTPTSNWQITFF